MIATTSRWQTDVAWEQPSMAAKRKLEDIAPFALLPSTAWDVKGVDLSIPFRDKNTSVARKDLESFLATLDAQPKDARTKEIRVIAYHNLAMAKKMLKGKKQTH